MGFDTAALKERPILVMTYSHDGFGLGHLRRNTIISSRFVREFPLSSVLMIVGCPSGAFFQLPSGVDFIKIPSVIKVDTGMWHPRTLRIDFENLKALRSFTIQKASEIFSPDIFIVDYAPGGIYGELLPTLKMLKERPHPPLIVLGLRDILDAPEVTRELWEKENTYQIIKDYYDKVFIYGSPEVFPTADAYGLTDEIPDKIRYCGYLCSGDSYKPTELIRQELQVQKDKLVVITAGAGHDAFPMMHTCMQAFQHLSKNLSVEAIFITGGLMEQNEREILEKMSVGFPIRILKCVDNNLSYLNAADTIVTMGGYNTLVDAVYLQKPIIIIPREGPSQEQKIRAQVFSQLGLTETLAPENLSYSVLAEAIKRKLNSVHKPIRIPFKMNGLENFFKHITKDMQRTTRHLHLAKEKL